MEATGCGRDVGAVGRRRTEFASAGPMTRRVALVGLSWIAADHAADAADPTLGTAIPYSHASAIAAIPELELVAGLRHLRSGPGHVPGTLVGPLAGPAVYDDYREMLRTERPELVAVVTPDHLHAAVVEAAIEAGARGIFCEKPTRHDPRGGRRDRDRGSWRPA